MNRLELAPDSVDSPAISKAVEVLKKEGVIVYPTETVYGLGADIFSEKAVERVYSLKGREKGKPLSIALSSVSDIEKYADTKGLGDYMGLPAMEFIRKNLPGPFTVILEKKELVPDYISRNRIGIRVPEYACVRRLVELAGPITSTSANISGSPPPKSADEVDIKADLLLDAGECVYGKPSRVIDLVSGKELR